MTIAHLYNGELAQSWREKLNRVIDTANASLNPSTFQGPPGPKGERGEKGEKGDIGDYIGVALSDVYASVTDLPPMPAQGSGTAAGVETAVGLDLYVYSTLRGWRNYGSITGNESRNVDETVFVAPDGDDDADGRTYGKAVRSLEVAKEIADNMSGSAGYDARPTTILVYPGEYPISGDIAWPDKCSVIGLGGARKTRVIPRSDQVAEGQVPYKNRNAFLLGDGGYVDGFSFNNFQIFNGESTDPDEEVRARSAFDNPTSGFAIAFRPGAVINRVPYAHNITAYTTWPPRSLISPPHDRKNGNPGAPVGGGVCIADGSIISMYSAFPNIMTWGATPSTPNGVGYLATKGGFLNPINAICLFAHKHFMVKDGAQMVLSGCSSQFGDYSLWSEGFLFSLIPEKQQQPIVAKPFVATAILENKTEIQAKLWLYINKGNISEIDLNNLCGCTCSVEEYYASFLRDTEYLLQAIYVCLANGTSAPIDQFVRGLFDWNAQFVSEQRCLREWARWYYGELQSGVRVGGLQEILKQYIGDVDTQNSITELMRMLAQTLLDSDASETDRKNIKRERSLLTSINHQWTFPLAGVSRYATPTRFRNAGRAGNIRRSIKQQNGGRVRYSGQDDDGNAVFVGGLEIEARSGELRGPPFEAAVRKRATRITFARSFR